MSETFESYYEPERLRSRPPDRPPGNRPVSPPQPAAFGKRPKSPPPPKPAYAYMSGAMADAGSPGRVGNPSSGGQSPLSPPVTKPGSPAKSSPPVTKPAKRKRRFTIGGGSGKHEKSSGSGPGGKGPGKGSGKGSGGKKRKFKISKKQIIALTVLLVVIIVAWRACSNSPQAMANAYIDAQAAKKDLKVSLSGTGTVTPNDQYTVTARAVGDILSADFEEGDIVKKGALLYKIEAKDVETNIRKAEEAVTRAKDTLKSASAQVEAAQRGVATAQLGVSNAQDSVAAASAGVASAQNGIQSAQNTLNNLRADKEKQERDLTSDSKIQSTETGQVTHVYYSVGDIVTAGSPVADIQDNAVMLLKVPFHAADAGSIIIGSSATVTITTTGEIVSGTVSDVSTIETVGLGGALVREVKIRVSNPGGITDYTYASAQIGTYACQSSGTFELNANKTVIAKYSGEVERIHVAEGGHVSSYETLITLKRPRDTIDYDKQIEDAKIAIEQQNISLSNARTQLNTAQTGVKNAQASVREAQAAVDEAKRGEKTAQDGVRTAQEDLKDAKDAVDDFEITAPIEGEVIEKNYKLGDNYDPTSVNAKPLAVIFDMSSISFTMNVDELDVLELKVGQEVNVTAEALPDRKFKGKIDTININGITENGVTTYPISIELEKAKELMPGMNVTGELVMEQLWDVLTIPTEAVSRGNTVLVRKDDAPGDPDDEVPAGFERIEIQVGATDGTDIQVISGLKEGDTVSYTPPMSNTMFMGPMIG